jgi:hypothetical protein
MNISCQVSDRIPCARDETIYSALDEFRPYDIIYLDPKDSLPPHEIALEDLCCLLAAVRLATQPGRKDTILADPKKYSRYTIYMAAREKVLENVSFKDAHQYIEENNEIKGPLKVELYKPTNAGDLVKKYGSLEKTELWGNEYPTIRYKYKFLDQCYRPLGFYNFRAGQGAPFFPWHLEFSAATKSNLQPLCHGQVCRVVWAYLLEQRNEYSERT